MTFRTARALVLLAAAGLSVPVAGAEPAALPMSGTVAVTTVGDGAADPSFADAVGQAFGDANFTLLPGHSRYVAQVSVAQQRSGVTTTKVSHDHASAGFGGVVVPFGSKTALRDLVTTTLVVRLLPRAGGEPLWSGSAVTVQVDGTPVATRLARAAVASYPQTMPAPVAVP